MEVNWWFGLVGGFEHGISGGGISDISMYGSICPVDQVPLSWFGLVWICI